MSKRLIDADSLKRAFCNHCDGDEPCTEPCIEIGLIETAPTIDAVEVVHGSWIEAEDFDELIKGSVICSNCRGQYQSLIIRNNEIEMRANKTPYCPNCGAKMDGEVKKDG